MAGSGALALEALGGVIVYLSPPRPNNEPPAYPVLASGEPAASTRERLRDLDDLRASEAVTLEEYELARRRIVDDL